MHSVLGIDSLRDWIDRTIQHAEFTIVASSPCVIVKATMLPGTGNIGPSCWRGRWRSHGIGHAPFARDTGLPLFRRRHPGPTEGLPGIRGSIRKRQGAPIGAKCGQIVEKSCIRFDGVYRKNSKDDIIGS